ncbi:MAG: hypothetical protein A3B99_03735 [Candidatus Yanofskybacteria bacterium RIFCSPHIGHO2_02_FULL_44_12b]|uniref:Uncharacterized protein n=2 Tax=Candidatus Yanofskyibacteriota TaxID=1752733 RepID=A0A1F8GPV5_9BACT|nr:MAG: hypothetical protein UW79_C0010G0005 [Candidatus Yanofskybacteria bacterium GW2011_GWA2_44_9]OGN04705.1 MAG: hypothetical protein A2659_01105 [Candidatus Yanofskybacteria bacterium RIFCSPHIGHO2_01_FULL_44_24]OGN15631.1 MAG: hypothetical protein A3B99_03735 [Candidatus Yanofskybacteria bacterium RIFCSPHIGHO2_02_FULL_44_12b]OGN26686.1 MAG: hypothetical protein A2925_03820 [Candidatus Yanofskybacteria bacterium RIFCSPLOWO2_01_FULL_44_22]
MRYPLNNYVDAFMEALEKASQEKAISGFVRLLKKTGDIKAADKIFTAIHKKMINLDGGRWVKVETAREISEKKLEALEHKFSKKDHAVFSINPDLVAGLRVTVNGEEELDNSLQNKLNKLFK